MTDDERRQLAELYREHDRMMTEDNAWLAKREAEREALMRKSDAEGVLYREQDGNAQGRATPTDAGPKNESAAETDEWAGWNAWMRGHLDIERQAIREELETTLVELIVELRKKWREEVTKAVAKRDKEIANLRGQVETLTRLYAGKSADVIDLPSNWKPKDVA